MKVISRTECNMSIAEVIAKRSSCQRLQVGCVITINHRIISSGYNGNLASAGSCEQNCNIQESCKTAIHAEANAICHAAKEGISLKGATIYCTHSPCIKCAELIIQSGIISVMYKEEYRETAPLLLLRKNNVIVNKYEPTSV